MEVIIGICLTGFLLIASKLGGLFDSVNDLSLKRENKTQGNMAKVSEATEVTIRNRVKDLGKSLNLPPNVNDLRCLALDSRKYLNILTYVIVVYHCTVSTDL